MTFKDFIKKERLRREMGVTEFASLLGASRFTVWRWEKGIVEPIFYTKKIIKEKLKEL